MSRFRPRRPSPALVISMIALIVALGGTAYASSVANNSVGTKQLKNNAVTTKKIKNGAVTTNKLKNGAVTTKQLKNGAVTASKINTSGLTVPNALHANSADTATTATNATNATHATTADSATSTSVVSIHATKVVDAAASLITAPQIPLGSKGPFSFYGRCYVNLAGEVEATTYISSTSNTGMFDTEAEDSGYVIPSTAEIDRELQDVATAGANTFVAGDGDKDFMATDGTTTIYGIVGLAAAKRGTPPGGDGPFGSGPNRCMFGEVIFG
jgi:hypothetical protein